MFFYLVTVLGLEFTFTIVFFFKLSMFLSSFEYYFSNLQLYFQIFNNSSKWTMCAFSFSFFSNLQSGVSFIFKLILIWPHTPGVTNAVPLGLPACLFCIFSGCLAGLNQPNFWLNTPDPDEQPLLKQGSNDHCHTLAQGQSWFHYCLHVLSSEPLVLSLLHILTQYSWLFMLTDFVKRLASVFWLFNFFFINMQRNNNYKLM